VFLCVRVCWELDTEVDGRRFCMITQIMHFVFYDFCKSCCLHTLCSNVQPEISGTYAMARNHMWRDYWPWSQLLQHAHVPEVKIHDIIIDFIVNHPFSIDCTTWIWQKHW
jgi:hypothetical protein